MSVRWEVATLKISADPAGTSLYANGRMQVAANVLIKAFNPTDKSSYTLTAAELARIELCDYYNTNEKLTGPWTYTATENEFAHTMPLGSVPNDFDDVDVAKASAQAAMADQHKKYWVSTTRAEVKSVGARIQQPNGTVITTRNAPNDSNIAFRASVDIRYSLANTEWWREDTTHGSGWDQDNYFLRSKGHRFIRADRQHFSGSNYPVVGMRNSIAYHQGGPNLHFFWPMGGRATQRVGLTHYADGRVHPRPWAVDIVIRQHADAFCLTRMITSGPKDIWKTGWYYSPFPRVTLFDLFGNSGTFEFVVNDSNILRVQNYGTKSAESLDSDIINVKNDGTKSAESSDTIHYIDDAEEETTEA